MRARATVAALALGMLGLAGPAAAGHAADGPRPPPTCMPGQTCPSGSVNVPALSAGGDQGLLAEATDSSFPAESVN